MPTSIERFCEEYAFLSNFHPSPIVYAWHAYATVEHLFQASKAVGPLDCEYVRLAPTPSAAKARGRRVSCRPDWNDVRLDVMAACLALKFAQGSPLAARLLATGDASLIEGNTWGDSYWGVCRGIGENHLGRLLMERREALRSAAPNGALEPES